MVKFKEFINKYFDEVYLGIFVIICSFLGFALDLFFIAFTLFLLGVDL